MFPRYLNAQNSVQPPLEPNTQDWQWVRDIMEGVRPIFQQASRRLIRDIPPYPQNHFLYASEWRIFTGQKIQSVVDKAGLTFIKQCLNDLEEMLRQ